MIGQGGTMRRRDFVTGGLVLATGHAALPRWAAAQKAPRIDRIIDAHCHLFNADDLPIEGFVKKIILPQTAQSNQLVARFAEYPGALQALVHALAKQVKSAAPGRKAETDKIDEFEKDPAKKPTRAWREREDLKNLESTFRLIWSDSALFTGLSLSQRTALKVALEHLQLFLYQQEYSLFGKPYLTDEEREELRNARLDILAAQLYPRDDLVGRYIRWALLFTRYRYELAEELEQLHGQAARKPRIVLMTPAIVDFSKWLEDENHSPIEDQVEAMARVARRKSGPRVHGFVGFDPLRQALYDHGKLRPGEKDPMAVLRHAIEVNQIGVGPAGRATGGALGVKLYPPMGFRATGNATLEDERFSEPGYLATHDRGLGPRVGEKLDAALSRLYAWCGDNNVPLMSHTNDTYGPNRDYETRAHPRFWAEVLRPAAHPKLRINMAHFGHFNEAVPLREPGKHIAECWEWVVGEIITASPDGYAYADISSLSELLKFGPSRQVLDCMKAFRDRFPSSAERLMYGTDWSMIGKDEGFPRMLSPKSYPDFVIQFLQAAGYRDAEIEAIMFRNAARFLGLSKAELDTFGDNSSRGRLEKFYAAHKLDTAWMKAFD
jgi:predicted TIM-barrel fold metal-dependent hydrolase